MTTSNGVRGTSGNKVVLQFRLDAHVYEELKAQAKKKRLTISQEAARRIEDYPKLKGTDLHLSHWST